LPLHFATSGLNASVSILELRGNNAPALTTLGVAAAAIDTCVGAAIE
jgi:hypothetical protein